MYRSDFDLEARAFERVHEVRRSAFDFAAIELTGPRRAPVERLDLFSARYNDVRKEFLGHVSRYTFAGEPPALDEPLAFTTPAPNNSVRFVDSDLAFVSREHTAALWPFAPERNVAYTAYALQERAATSSVTQIAFVPELGLILGDASGGLSVHPTRLGAAPEPIASSMSSEVLALESIVGGFVAVERGSLWHHRVTDGTSTVCPRVSVQAEASAFVVEVGDALVVVSSVGDSVAVEWLAPPEGA